MNNYEKSLHNSLLKLNDILGGDIGFIAPVDDEIECVESAIKWNLPSVFRFFYSKETNGLIIDDKRIYSIYNKDQKKTWVDNIERMNDPKKSPWFKNRPHIFDDYFIIGCDGSIIFCLSKKYNFPNPSLYICKNSNDPKGVTFVKLNLDLESLILEMVTQSYDIEWTSR